MRFAERIWCFVLLEYYEGSMHRGPQPAIMRVPKESTPLSHNLEPVNVRSVCLNRTLRDVGRSIRPCRQQLTNSMPVNGCVVRYQVCDIHDHFITFPHIICWTWELAIYRNKRLGMAEACDIGVLDREIEVSSSGRDQFWAKGEC